MPELGDPLSEREVDVLECVAVGASNKEIADDLTISHNTVKVHLRNIYTKLGVSSRTEAVTVALQQGVVAIPGEETAETPPPADPEPETAVSGLPPPSSEVGLAVEVGSHSKPEPAATRNWQVWALGGLVLVLLVGVLAIALPDVGLPGVAAVATPEPFIEEPIPDTRWSVSRSMAAPRAGFAAAAVGLNVYEIGGEGPEGVVDSVSVFDTTSHSRTEGARKPTAVADTGAAVLFGEIYVPGGRLADGQPTDIVEAYSPSQNAWRPVAALPQPVAGGVTLADRGFLYLFGGWNGRDYLDTAYVYDPGADSWRPLPPLAQPRAYAAGGSLTGHLYVVGGFDGERELANCEVFDPAQNSWSACPSLLQARTGAGSAVLVNKLYIIGGSATGEPVSFSEVFDPNSGAWQVVNTPMLDDGGWANLGVANVETRIYALGGKRGDELLADNYVYSPFAYQTFIPAGGRTDN